MTLASQNRAIKNYRRRLSQQGVARFEVLALASDRDLIRSLAKRLTRNDPRASRIRSEIRRTMAEEPAPKGGLLAALRRSPLVGTDLDIVRSTEPGRKVQL
jgi:hypothetical protein